MPQVPRFVWNRPGVARWLATSPEVLDLIERKTKKMVEDVKEDILQNHTSHQPRKNPYNIQRSAAYFANNVRGQILRTTRGQSGIPIGTVAMKADNAIAYEASHGNLERVRAQHDGH